MKNRSLFTLVAATAVAAGAIGRMLGPGLPARPLPRAAAAQETPASDAEQSRTSPTPAHTEAEPSR